MNFGIYIDKVADHAISTPVFNCLNRSVYNPMYKDASLFYNDIGPQPCEINCGMFNSTDLQFFEGNLLVMFLDGTKTTDQVVSNCNVYVLYDKKNQANIFDLLNIKDATILAANEETELFLLSKLPGSKFPVCGSVEDAYHYILGNENAR